MTRKTSKGTSASRRDFLISGATVVAAAAVPAAGITTSASAGTSPNQAQGRRPGNTVTTIAVAVG